VGQDRQQQPVFDSVRAHQSLAVRPPHMAIVC
jgi:hypothetical protein